MTDPKIYKSTPILSFCLETQRYYQSNTFPKVCKKCNKIYHNREQYILETLSLKKGSFSRGAHGKILEYRNCLCKSTLTCVMESRRDNSPEGLKQREIFEKEMKVLVDSGVDKNIARGKILKKFKV